MEQDKLKVLLKSIITQIENESITTLDEIIGTMQNEFQKQQLALG